MTRRYAEKTKVPIGQSRTEIEALLKRYGASAFMSGSTATEAVVAFEMKDRKIMFRVPMPKGEQECRSRWRALVLSIKAKLEAVEVGISLFEDEFLAHIVMPDGATVSEHTRPLIARSYETGQVTPLLPGPKP